MVGLVEKADEWQSKFYRGDEQAFDELSEPEEPEYYEEGQGDANADGEAGGTEDADARQPNGAEASNIVISGDAPAAAAAQNRAANTVLEKKNKKVPNDKRNTTPYMTKYERARVLGTRALQIRCVRSGSVEFFAPAQRSARRPVEPS